MRSLPELANGWDQAPTGTLYHALKRAMEGLSPAMAIEIRR
jgi:hypothetical protein